MLPCPHLTAPLVVGAAKKNPLQDLAHFQYANQEPLMEGEAGPVLARTGSDGCLSEAHRRGDSELLLRGLELGPQLGMVKSSSLESLHNVMQHSIQRDMVDDGSELRNRHTRNSFRRAVDRSLEQQQQQQQQRGVDGETHTHTHSACIGEARLW